jgi:hypothetical protein
MEIIKTSECPDTKNKLKTKLSVMTDKVCNLTGSYLNSIPCFSACINKLSGHRT